MSVNIHNISTDFTGNTIGAAGFAGTAVQSAKTPSFKEKPNISSSVSSISKRAFDIAFSLFVIAGIMSWLLPILALFIRLTSDGPVFFVQERTGKKNKPFLCIKLRSMYLNTGAHVQQAVANDARVTPAGRFLRKFSLDELPQFFNVLAGQMSVVGPRPHMTHHTMAYTPLVNEYPLRHFVRPGITGLSQVMGYRGEIKDKQMLSNRIRLDIFYLKKWNFLLDMQIIIKTLKLIVLGDEKAV